jgi:diadenosine tetraphosphatase ApaH/serine/threonine PP2A family protein phosphatase
MKILIISDVHGNQEAMEACLAAAKGPFDRVYNLGDIVGYGASPNEVVARSRDLGGLFVRGNHDKACSGVADANDFNHIAALAAYWTRDQLTPENLEWVKNLPQGPILPGDVPNVQCVHGSPLNEDEYIIVVRDAYEPLIASPLSVTFFGHTHIQGGFSAHDDQWSTLRPVYEKENEAESFTLHLSGDSKYLINPGSVGQPRDGDWRAAFATYDTEANAVTFHRVPYDVESAQRKIFEANLPDRLATRLREGR